MHEVLARLAELRQVGEDRLVRLDHLRGQSPPPPGPAKPPACCCCGESVTVRSVPMLDSGFSAVFCAWSSPRESETIAMTRPTPTASPSTVRIVRALRRSSSLRRYER